VNDDNLLQKGRPLIMRLRSSCCRRVLSEGLITGKLAPDASDRVKIGIIQLLLAENARINLPNGEAAKQAATTASCGNGTDDCEGDESDYGPSMGHPL
jgi:hypothetical protein